MAVSIERLGKDRLLTAYAFHLSYVRLLVENIPDELWHAEPEDGQKLPNHPAWQLGHMAIAADGAARLLEAAPMCPSEWGAMFGRGSVADRPISDFPDRETLVAALEKAHANVQDAYLKADQALFLGDNPNERLKPGLPTVGDMVTFLIGPHEAIHSGQISAWRRAHDLPPVVG